MLKLRAKLLITLVEKNNNTSITYFLQQGKRNKETISKLDIKRGT